MLEKLKLLLGIPDSDTSEDDLLELLLDQATTDAEAYCNTTYTSAMDNVIIQMAIVHYNQIGTEGATMERFTGAVQQIAQTYPDWIYSQLRAFRRIRTVG